MKNPTLISLATLLILSAAAPAKGQQHLGSVPVQANVSAECVLVAPRDLAFTNYDILGKNSGGTLVTTTGGISIRCTGVDVVYLQVGSGLHASTTSCGDFRRMKSTTDNSYISYSIYHPTLGKNYLWESYNPGQCPANANSHALGTKTGWHTRETPGYIKPHQHDVRAGHYTDTLTIYLSF